MFSWWLCGTYTVTFRQDLKKRYHLKVKNTKSFYCSLSSLTHSSYYMYTNSCHPEFVTPMREEKNRCTSSSSITHSVQILILVKCNSYFFLVQRRGLTSPAITSTSCKFTAENKHDHLQFPVVTLAALNHKRVHHGYWQPSKWSANVSPSRIATTIFTKLCAAVQVEHTQQSKVMHDH